MPENHSKKTSAYGRPNFAGVIYGKWNLQLIIININM